MNELSLIISAPSGAGKTTLIQRLLKRMNMLEFSVSTTTRPKRSGETEGKSYYFINPEEFDRMIRAEEFLEWAEVHCNYYGTTKKEIDRIQDAEKIPVFDVDVQGTKSLRGKIEGGVYIFVVPPSLTLLEQRLKSRGTDSDEQIRIRLANAASELREYHLFDYIVVNDELETAEENLCSIVRAEFCRTHRALPLIEKMLEGL